MYKISNFTEGTVSLIRKLLVNAYIIYVLDFLVYYLEESTLCAKLNS